MIVMTTIETVEDRRSRGLGKPYLAVAFKPLGQPLMPKFYANVMLERQWGLDVLESLLRAAGAAQESELQGRVVYIGVKPNPNDGLRGEWEVVRFLSAADVNRMLAER